MYVTVYFLSYPFVVKAFATSYVWLLFAVLPPVDPFPLYVTVYAIGVHFAYTVILLVGVYVASDILFVHAASLYHPPNVYPVLLGV